MQNNPLSPPSTPIPHPPPQIPTHQTAQTYLLSHNLATKTLNSLASASCPGTPAAASRLAFVASINPSYFSSMRRRR